MSTLGSRIDRMWQLREDKRQLEAEMEAVEKQIHDIEHELLSEMDTQETSKAAGSLASVTVSESVKPSVEDWDAFHGYILRHKAFHLLERRASVTGCRELFETKGVIPGVVPYLQRRLRLTTIPKEKS